MQAKLGVLRDFYKYSASKLVTFGNNVAVNVDVTEFTNLPFAPKDIEALTATLSAAEAATITGGTVATAARDNAFDAVTNALNADANVVENGVNGNLEKLLATGYLPVSTNRASVPLDDTSIVSLMNNGTTQVLLRLQPVTNARNYQVQTSADGGKTWIEFCLSSQARRNVITNLVPGTTYAVRARAIGGSTGASNWTAPMSIMST
jgi:hypothetical protein